MIADIGSGRKTVADEGRRLIELVITKQVLSKSIDEARAKALCNRISAVVFDIFGDPLNLMLQLGAIETVICCKTCNGTGIQTIANGYDAGEYSVATETVRQRCKCCGG